MSWQFNVTKGRSVLQQSCMYVTRDQPYVQVGVEIGHQMGAMSPDSRRRQEKSSANALTLQTLPSLL